MPEFLTLLPPDEARALLLSHLPQTITASERIDVGPRWDVSWRKMSSHRSPCLIFNAPPWMDTQSVLNDTHGVSDSLPTYLSLIGEVPMGDRPAFEISAGQCALIHTGGVLPKPRPTVQGPVRG